MSNKKIGDVIYFKLTSDPMEHIHKGQIKYIGSDYQGTYYLTIMYVENKELRDEKIYKVQCVDDEIGKVRYEITESLYKQERVVKDAQAEYERLRIALRDIGKEPDEVKECNMYSKQLL